MGNLYHATDHKRFSVQLISLLMLKVIQTNLCTGIVIHSWRQVKQPSRNVIDFQRTKEFVYILYRDL